MIDGTSKRSVNVRPNSRLAVWNAASMMLSSCKYGFTSLSEISNSATRRFSE
jgi:hypothetical protein